LKEIVLIELETNTWWEKKSDLPTIIIEEGEP
jgi:hypothetical protein